MMNEVLNNVTLAETFDFKGNLERIFDSLDVNENTRAEYAYFAKAFLSFIKEHGFNRNSFLEYKRYLLKRTDYSVSTKNKYLTTARILLKEMNRIGAIPFDITHNIKTFTQTRKHKRAGLDEEEIGLLLERVNQLGDSRQNVRLKAILSLLILQGLRQCEIVRLDVKDIDLVNNLAFVRGKGSDDTEPIHLHPVTVKALREYLKKSRISFGAVFVSWSNNNRNKRMTTHALRRIVKETLMALKIPKTVHGFRHYFTTTLLKEYGGDLLQVARYTRHKSLEMIRVYDDSIKQKADLPRFYKAFRSLDFEKVQQNMA